MTLQPVYQLLFIVAASTLCQMLGWRYRVPSILLLLISGIVAGPILNLVDPEPLFGQSLIPLIEMAVAIILFEGGLSLSQRELGRVGPIVWRLISVGLLITWVLLMGAAYFVLQLEAPVAALLGAILVVTGPTVVIPLLKSIRAKLPLEPILRWEGILIDPIGVVLAVLVAEACETGFGYFAPLLIVQGMVVSLVIGASLGWLGALVLRFVIGGHRVADQFSVPFSLVVLFSFVALANLLHSHSGLLTSTVMGVVLASYRANWVKSIESFIVPIQGLFIGILFIVLAARLDPRFIQYLDTDLLIFILVVVLLVRPVAIFISTWKSGLTIRQRAALASLAPRGIVSAALAASLGGHLAGIGIPGMEQIEPYTFATIIGSVLLYGVFSPGVFGLLGVRQRANEGIVIVGADKFAMAFAKIITGLGLRVLLVDTNRVNVRRCRSKGLEAINESILGEGIHEDVSLDGLGKLLTLTANDELNVLALSEFEHVFGAANLFRVAAAEEGSELNSGRVFASKELNIERLDELWEKGYRPKLREIPTEASRAGELVGTDEFLLAEIEGERLFLPAADGLRRAANPNKIVVFSAS